MLSNKIKSLIALTLLALTATACGGTSNTDVAVIVALTQTAAALQAPATSTVTAVPATEAPTSTSTSTAVPPTAMPAGYYPLTNDECTAVQNSLTGVLSVAPAVLNPAPFTDYSNNTSGTACQLTYTGDGNNNFSTGPDAFLATSGS